MNSVRPDDPGARSLNDSAMDVAHFSNDDLLRLLIAVRGSAIPDNARTELRDLVLEYAQIEDMAARAEAARRLSAALAPYPDLVAGGVKPANAPAPQPAQQPAPATGAFGRSRVRPSFSAPAQPAVSERPLVYREQPTTPPQPAPGTPPPEPEEIQQPTEDAPAPHSAFDPKTRIAEIKRAVNEAVGNPVNIIERDKAVGQEYMSALLDAIKRSAPGGTGIDAAMERLERAFVAVTKLAENEPVQQPPEPEAKAAPQPSPQVQPNPQPSPVPPPSRPIPLQKPTPSSPVSRVRIDDNASSRLTSLSALRPKPAVKQPVSEARVAAALRGGRPKDDQQQTAPVATAPKPAVAPQQPVPKRPLQPAPQPADEFHTAEINAGLAQLLSEWRLFAKSGFLGTGPSGIDHPLYKKLAPLPMAAIVAGRFEGSTPEIRQNIADYMNGWRYEQGVVHRMEEQFEVYLRRVIKRIVERQKQNAPQRA